MKELLNGSLFIMFLIAGMATMDDLKPQILVPTGDQIVGHPAGQRFINNGDRILIIKGKIKGSLKSWMVIEAHNAEAWKVNGFEPTYTRIIADNQPVFRKMPNGTWEIMFQ